MARERVRIARELHDVVAHSVSVMVVQAGAARSVLDRDPDASVRALGAVEATGREALTEMRRLLGILRPDGQDADHSPQPSLDRLAALIARSRDAGLDVELRVEGEAGPLAPGVDLTAFRLVQEGLTNALKHGGRGQARVVLRWSAELLEVEVANRITTARRRRGPRRRRARAGRHARARGAVRRRAAGGADRPRLRRARATAARARPQLASARSCLTARVRPARSAPPSPAIVRARPAQAAHRVGARLDERLDGVLAPARRATPPARAAARSRRARQRSSRSACSAQRCMRVLTGSAPSCSSIHAIPARSSSSEKVRADVLDRAPQRLAAAMTSGAWPSAGR